MPSPATHALAAALIITLLSCGNKPQSPQPPQPVTPQENTGTTATCTYTYVHDSTTVSFTAYKFEGKTGVGGTFDHIEVYPLTETGPLAQVLNAMEFRIPVQGTNTANDDRDNKIKDHFWGNLKNTATIMGQIVEVSGTETEGKLMASITLNEVTHQVPGTYTLANGNIRMAFELDMTQFDGLQAIAALNKVCEDLHREAPGQKSVLWPNVSVAVSGFLRSNCPGAN
jgi:polyisoprenoid-binding protein YceI